MPIKQKNLRNVIFTSYESTYEDIQECIAKLRPAWYAFQLEQCPTTSRHHIQGSFGGKQWSFSRLKKVLPVGTHIESCIDPRASYEYCSKEDTRLADPVKSEAVPAARRNQAGDRAARNR